LQASACSPWLQRCSPRSRRTCRSRQAPVYKAPPAVYVYSWTGCFVGGHGGGLWARKDWNVAAGDSGIGVAGIAVGTPFGTHDANSWLGGVQVGCDYQFAGGFVIGIQGDYAWTDAKGTSADAVNNAGTGTTDWTDQSRIKSLGSVTGRLGYAWDRFLGYVRGGWAWERDDYAIFDRGVAFATASETRSGWTVGVGGEYAFTNWLTGFAEYNYYDFGTRTNTFPVVGDPTFDVVDIKERKSVFKVGLNLRWGGGPVAANY
jgi:outer membrane immunogenic protein